VKTITYIFPVYNNAPSLRPLYDEMCAMTARVAGRYGHRFLFVNDGSRDESGAVLAKLAADDPEHVRVLSLSRNFGHQAAVSAGMARAEGDAIVIMDADLQDPPDVCLELIARWEEGFQVVYAQRRSRRDSLFKRVTAVAFYRVLGRMSTVDIPPDTGDFRLVDRVVLDVVNGMREHHRFLRGMYGYAGFRHAPVAFDRRARVHGHSEYTLRRLIGLARDGIFGFSDLPLKVAAPLGLVATSLALLFGFAAVVLAVLPSTAAPAWLGIMTGVLLVGGVQLLILGIIGEYIARIHDEVRGRPAYIVAADSNAGEGA
jgi:polyisoprenyl-phosphate glycosyltransferase